MVYQVYFHRAYAWEIGEYTEERKLKNDWMEIVRIVFLLPKPDVEY